MGSYTDERDIGILMEPVAECDLMDFLEGLHHQEMELNDKLSFLRSSYGCIASAVLFLHSQKIRHRDLKPQNILIHERQIYLTDFGEALDWSRQSNSTTRDQSIRYTEFYRAPECSQGNSRSSKTDMWSLGVVFLEMTTVLRRKRVGDFAKALVTPKRDPYPHSNLSAVTAWLTRLQEEGNGLARDLEPLSWIKSLLQQQARHRPTASSLFQQIQESPSSQHFCGICCSSEDSLYEEDLDSEGDVDNRERTTRESNVTLRETIDGLLQTESSLPPRSKARDFTIESWMDSLPSMPGEFPVEPLEPDEEDNPAFTIGEAADSDTPQEPVYYVIDDSSEDDDDEISYDDIKSNEKLFDIVSDTSGSDLTVRPLNEVSPAPDRMCHNRTAEIDTSGAQLHPPHTDSIVPLDSRLSSSATATPTLVLPVLSHESSLDEPLQETDLTPKGISDCVNPTDPKSHQETTLVSLIPRNTFPNATSPHTANETKSVTRYCEPDLFSSSSKQESQNFLKQSESNPKTNTTSQNITDEHQPINEAVSRGSSQKEGRKPLKQPDGKKKTDSISYNLADEHQPADKANTTFQESSRKVQINNLSWIRPIVSASDNRNQSKQERSLAILSRQRCQRPAPLSPSDFLDKQWEEGSVATSAMSASTRKLFQHFTLLPWRDFHENLVGIYAKTGNPGAVRYLLQLGCNPGTLSQPRPQPLIDAIKGRSPKHVKCAKALLDHGAHVNVKVGGKTPLHYAIENKEFHGYKKLLRVLIDAGADTNAADKFKDRPLIKILQSGSNSRLLDHEQATLALLLKSKSTEVNISTPGSLDFPLHLAVRRRDPLAVGMLLETNAAVNQQNASGASALSLAASQWRRPMTDDQISILDLLSDRKYGVDINDLVWQRSLHLAIERGIDLAVEMLLERGARPKLEDDGGFTPLQTAARFAGVMPIEAHSNIMEDLLAALHSPLMQHVERGTCLLSAIFRNDGLDLLKALIDHGIGPGFRFGCSRLITLTFWAIKHKNLRALEYLKHEGIDANVQNSSGVSALDFCAKGSDTKFSFKARRCLQKPSA